MRPTKKCPKCGELRKMTGHHLMPIRHFGRKGNRHILLLCRRCHNDLENILLRREQRNGKLPKLEYFYTALKFLEEVVD